MAKKITIGFIINPIAGMGGRVGLKGTDGKYDEAVQRGASPIAQEKAIEALQSYLSSHDDTICDLIWLSAGGSMGADALEHVGITPTIIYTSSHRTEQEDTIAVSTIFLKKNVDLIVFCGGDGTARDIVSIVDKNIPILGIPSGVKMHSGVFGVNARATGAMIHEFLHHHLTIGDVEIMDLDEDLYRQGIWKVRLFGSAKGIIEPTFVQVGKMSFVAVSEDEVKEEIADHIQDEMKQHHDILYLFGSGGTIDFIAQRIGITNTLLGIDAVYQQEVIGSDLNEQEILTLLNRYPKRKLILSPIGAQGFILGRGNLQISPAIIKRIGIENIIVVATPAKLLSTPMLRVDTGDLSLDKEFAAYEMILVVIGYRLRRVVKIQQL
jgi:predicted polyphosphate/ATP-dependent NAD kinase